MSQPRCFTRYNNNGGKYTTCNDNDADPSKAPAPRPPLISVDTFLQQQGKGYSELTPGQKRAYHRIDMANRRKQERSAIEKGQAGITQFKKEKKAEREKWKQTKGTIMSGLKSKNKSLKERINELEKSIETGTAKIKEQQQEQKVAITEDQKELNANTTNISKLMDRMKIVNDFLDNQSENHKDYNKIQKEQISLQSKISGLTKENKKLIKDIPKPKPILISFG